MNQTTNQTSINFWIICSLALIWNLIGVFAYFGQTFMSEQILSSLSKTEQNYFLNMPVWVTASFATAVFTGVFGAISLLLKKKPAVFLFLISIILILTHQYYIFFIQSFIKVEGLGLILPLTTVFIGFYLLWFSIKMNKQGVLN
jgi:hypothetical protein